MEAGKVKYYVYVTTSKGTSLDVTQAVEDLGWEENAKELSMRGTFNLYNAKYNDKRLSSLIKIGNPVTIKANMGSGSKKVCTLYIKEAERDTTKSAEVYKITAYDCLFAMQKSFDDVYYAKGKKTKALLTAIFGRWNVKIDEYTGPDVKHGRVVYKNKSLSDIVLGILSEAAKKGGKKAHVRASGNKVSILANGSNTTVYDINSKNCIESKYKISITDMVTKVKITAAQKKNKNRTTVKATVKKNTKYGTIQRIQNYSKGDSLSDAKKAAKKILNENASPIKTRTVQCPDIPFVYKGDKIHVEAGSLKGDYLVSSIQHNAAAGKMSMDLKPAPTSSSSSSSSNKKSGSSSSTKKSSSSKSKSSTTKYKVTAKSGLHLRTAPNKKIIATMPYGTVVTSNGKKSGKWYHVTYKGRTGYAYSTWLKKQ